MNNQQISSLSDITENLISYVNEDKISWRCLLKEKKKISRIKIDIVHVFDS